MRAHGQERGQAHGQELFVQWGHGRRGALGGNFTPAPRTQRGLARQPVTEIKTCAERRDVRWGHSSCCIIDQARRREGTATGVPAPPHCQACRRLRKAGEEGEGFRPRGCRDKEEVPPGRGASPPPRTVLPTISASFWQQDQRLKFHLVSTRSLPTRVPWIPPDVRPPQPQVSPPRPSLRGALNPGSEGAVSELSRRQRALWGAWSV